MAAGRAAVTYWRDPSSRRRTMPRFLRAVAAACIFAAAGAALAATAPVADETLAPLTAAYARAVRPGEQADRYRELFGTVLQRVQRTYAREVDVAALIAVALKTVEPLEPQSGEPAEVFKNAINAALATLDPHSRYLDARAQRNQSGTMN